jgi:hypothetical protein
MRFAILAAVVLSACAGYTPGTESMTDSGPGRVGGPDGGDGGTDAGTDGGLDGGDGGCTARSMSNAGILDNCIGTNVVGTASVSVNATNCAALITSTTGDSCNGVAAGPNDAFDGGCGGFQSCSSTSLPGTIVCITGPSSSCTIVVDGGP